MWHKKKSYKKAKITVLFVNTTLNSNYSTKNSFLCLFCKHTSKFTLGVIIAWKQLCDPINCCEEIISLQLVHVCGKVDAIFAP